MQSVAADDVEGRVRFGLRSWSEFTAAVVIAAVAVAVVASGVDGGPGARPPAVLFLVAGLFLPLAWSRTHPRAVVAVVAPCTAALWVLIDPDWHTAAAGAVAMFGLGRHVERPSSVRWFAAVLIGLATVASLQAVAGDLPAGWFRVSARCGLVVAAFWIGDAQRSRAELLDSLRERAERAEEHRRVVERQARQQERNRIARDLHDVVAHSLSVVVVQATAAVRIAPDRPTEATEAMQSVADTGRSALGEMRSILGLLDDPDEPDPDVRAPQPAYADLRPLVERYRSAGLDVTVDAPTDLSRLGAAHQLTVVRIVQEALTNVLRHAEGSAATVRVVDGDPVVVEVVDDGAVTPVPFGDGRGRGLLGMSQRAEALGGTLVAGPRPGGGFGVRAVLPVPAATVRTGSTALGGGGNR
ncbi:MAG: sensor histidine kinase [Acidimicrobiales bacterium]